MSTVPRGMDKTGRGAGAGAGVGDRWIKPGDWELGDMITCITKLGTLIFSSIVTN